jgi:hypothetical protein
MKSNVLQTITLFTIMIILLPLITLAGPPPLDGDPGVPIDGGASLLVGAAAVYGIKKIKDRRKK